MSKHISSHFDNDINKIRCTIHKMGDLLVDRLDSVAQNIHSPTDPKKSAAFEESINKLEVNLDEECVSVLALHRPAAGDLRFVISAGRIGNDLESIGDEIARLSQGLTKLIENTSRDEDPSLSDIKQITINLVELLRSALTAYQEKDARGAATVVLQEREMEEQFQNAIRSRITMIVEEPRSVKSTVHCFWILRSLERIGKCTRQIANHILYLVEGSDVRHKSQEHLRYKFLGK